MISLILAVAFAADTTRYVVLNHGREAGEMTVARSGDTIAMRYSHIDRNRGLVAAHNYRVDRNGRVVFAEGLAWQFGGDIGAPNDRVELARDSAMWGVVPTQIGRAAWEPDMFPRLRGIATAYDEALIAKFLLARPDRHGRLMPGETPAHVDVITEVTVPTSSGKRRVKLVMLYEGPITTPSGLWLDDNNDLFAGEIGWFILVRAGGESALPELRAKEMAWRNARGLALAKSLARPKDGIVVIKNGDLFDSETGTIRPRTTIVARGDRIAVVGADPGSEVPAGATVIDATGKTVMPGMWEMHGHLQHTSQTIYGVMQLATGLTTVRDLASDVDVATWYRDRGATGDLLVPRSILAGFIEGPGLWAGPTDVIVRTEAEARAWVAKYDSMGYKQIKLYNIVHPDLVPTIAAEAHKRGMRLSGHIPRGLSVPAAIDLGFDEIQHAAFLFSTFFQDSLYVPKMRAYSQVASAVAPNVNVDGPEFTALIDVMKSHHTVLDGTYNIWTSTASAGVGAPPVNQKGIDNYYRTITRLDSAGVVLVPGTDNTTSSTYVAELECYVHAGIAPSKVLQMATIISARVMHDDANYGSIAVGKVADILVVNGKPNERITDLRNIDQVIRAGRVYTPTELREAIGIRAQPGTPR